MELGVCIDRSELNSKHKLNPQTLDDRKLRRGYVQGVNVRREADESLLPSVGPAK